MKLDLHCNLPNFRHGSNTGGMRGHILLWPVIIVTSVTIQQHKNGFQLHKKQHVHEKMKCEKCECKTVAKKNLVRHKRYEHEGIQYRSIKFVCNQCSIPLLLHGYKYFINALSMTTRQLSRFILFNTSTTLNFEVMNWHFWKKKIRRTNFLTRDQLNQLIVFTARQEKNLSTPTSNFWKCA